jgi:hypothetical protein
MTILKMKCISSAHRTQTTPRYGQNSEPWQRAAERFQESCALIGYWRPRCIRKFCPQGSMRSPRQLHHERSVRIVLDNRLETEHAEYDPVTYEYIAIVFMLGCDHSSEEFDALLIISAKDLRLASLDKRIQRLVKNLHVHAMKVLLFSCLSLDEFVQC